MSEENSKANDYALAKSLNERVINIFTLVIDHASTPDLTDVNRSYILLIEELKRIYDRQPELKKLGGAICWRVLDNLEQAHEFVPAIEFEHSGGDYGEEHNSSVSRLCIIADKEKPDLTPQLQKLLNDADKNIATFKSELDKMYARISFEHMVVPVVRIGDKKYYLPSMREGLAYYVISFCLKKHPNQEIGLDKLKAELAEARYGVSNLSNFNDDIRKSKFGKNNYLSPFVNSSTKSIIVKQITALTDRQIDEISAVSVEIISE